MYDSSYSTYWSTPKSTSTAGPGPNRKKGRRLRRTANGYSGKQAALNVLVEQLIGMKSSRRSRKGR